MKAPEMKMVDMAVSCKRKARAGANLRGDVHLYIHTYIMYTHIYMGFPGGSDGKGSACNVGDLGLIPGLGRSPGGEHGNPLQYSYLQNPMDRGGWWATVHESQRIGHDGHD